MELWWLLRGWVRLRLVSADCPGRLRRISGEMKLGELTFPDELTAEFTVSADRAKVLLAQYGAELTVVNQGGVPAFGRWLWSWRRLAAVVLLLGILTAVLPKRIWFLRVEGNAAIPARLILEKAEDCGVSFGVKAGAVRSEQVKNKLLYEIPELRWAGVNTSGCTAVITVAERQAEEAAGEGQPGDLVSAADGVVTELLLHRGTARIKPGDGVTKGQLLISGVTEQGVMTRASGEVWGMTRREIRVNLPDETVIRRETGGVVRKFSLRIGKKSVNFYDDSGILHGSCVRIRTVNYLTLPGGFRLPAALVTDTYYLCETQEAPRGETDWLLDSARRMLRWELRGGSVLREQVTQEGKLLTAVFECREQLGVFRPGEYMERDTFDRENGER